MEINWILLGGFAYVIIVMLVCLRIIYDTRNVTKALAYLLFAIFVPVAGMLFYFLVGTNYRERKIYSKKLSENIEMGNRLRKEVYQHSTQTFKESDAVVQSHKELACLLLNDSQSPLTRSNTVKVLLNGEKKFPEVLQALRAAKNHIHIEYYIYEDDEIGRAVEAVLIEKAKEGVAVRLIYDDLGSRAIRRRMAKRLKQNRVEVYPFFEIVFAPFANRLNYRNHRKIIVIDGRTAFTGGINVSDAYINDGKQDDKKLYWRDTHLRIDGPGVQYLQYLFLCDWNFCASARLHPDENFFPPLHTYPAGDDRVVQIAASGPDSETPTILFSFLTAINLATKEILIATPYFIPGESLLNALVIAALSGLSVKILVPGISDSVFVNLAARSYYADLLDAGVEIYQYQKGFLHAKTMITDKKIAIVGSANLDIRSFDYNFEVNAIIYDSEIARSLRDVFYDDLKDAEKIDAAAWRNRSVREKLLERGARLLSPLL